MLSLTKKDASPRNAIRSVKRYAPLTTQASINASRYSQLQLFASFLKLRASVADGVSSDALSTPLRSISYLTVYSKKSLIDMVTTNSSFTDFPHPVPVRF